MCLSALDVVLAQSTLALLCPSAANTDTTSTGMFTRVLTAAAGESRQDLHATLEELAVANACQQSKKRALFCAKEGTSAAATMMMRCLNKREECLGGMFIRRAGTHPCGPLSVFAAVPMQITLPH